MLPLQYKRHQATVSEQVKFHRACPSSNRFLPREDIVAHKVEVVDDEVEQVSDKVEAVAEVATQQVDLAQINDKVMQKC